MVTTSNVNFNYLLKYIIIGDSFVGKSNLLLRYAHNQFKPEYQLTIGVEFGAKNIILGNDMVYRIQIWDTAGQENFRSITRAYYKGSVCAIIVYDITNAESFHNVQVWIDDCKNQSPKTLLMVLVGNKTDLSENRKVTYEEGENFAKSRNMLFFETSAKMNENVEEIFVNSAKEIEKKIAAGYYDLTNDNCGIKLGTNTTTSLDQDPEAEGKGEDKKCCLGKI